MIMLNKLSGLHHITAIASDAKRNLQFYTRVLGLRLVKKTVNFDDPGTYHFYYGDGKGTPGTILTFFPWQHISKGRSGTGMATEIGFASQGNSLNFWKQWLIENGVGIRENIRFGIKSLEFEDPDGLSLYIVENDNDDRTGWRLKDSEIETPVKGFYSVSLALQKTEKTADLLTEIFDYAYIGSDVNYHRFQNKNVENAHYIDLLELPESKPANNGAGTNHHIAFRVPNEAALMVYREKLLQKGLHVTPKINRDYFYSIYFREPGGVLFEIATDNPGFLVDEAEHELGSSLKLPSRFETIRSKIELSLPKLS